MHGQDEEEEEEEDPDEQDDIQDAMVIPPTYLQKGPRSSVSAEAWGDWNRMKAYTPPFYPKTEEQNQRLLHVLHQSFLFNALERENLELIIGAMLERVAQPGERLIQEGDDGDVMYVIETGIADCIKNIHGEERIVKTCVPGDFFGELALLYNCPRAASVQARDMLVLWQLDRETFNHVVRDASMRKRQTYEAFLRCVPILEGLGDYERSQLADALQKEAVPAGAEVIRQGEEGSKFYLVEEGELVAMKWTPETNSWHEVKSYTRGEYFGELSLLREETRAASIVARTDTVLLWVDRRGFKSLLGPLEDKLTANAAAYA